MGAFLFNLMIGGCILVYFVVKVVRVVDDGGEIKKTANDGFAACFKKLFK